MTTPPSSERPGGPARESEDSADRAGSVLWEGIPASPGIVIGPARVLRVDAPVVPHGGGISSGAVEGEIERFRVAISAVKEQIRRLQSSTEERLGPVEAQIFEPQLLMLEDSDIIGGTESYIRENHLSAERAFEWRMLEWEAQWSHAANPMILEKLNDLGDVQARVLRNLLGLPEPELNSLVGDVGAIVIARDLTPSVAAQLTSRNVLGLATDAGTRTSHSSILARSLQLPSVVSLRDFSENVREGDTLILDGRTGRIIVNPSEEEKQQYRELDFNMREWEQELLLLAHLESKTRDGVEVALRGNIDLPSEAAAARAHGAQGIGLFRTEFLVVGRSAFPPEEQQYQAYLDVLNAFDGDPVVIRTYDLGGDKFPSFLHMPSEENPFLGWRAIRLCLDEPDLFRPQLKALVRARAHGDLRIMLPMVTNISEVTRTREMINDAARECGMEDSADSQLGVMIETPAAALIAAELAEHVDFFSIGTNDLVQYTLAVDRGSSRLASLYNPFHPAVLRLIDHVARVGRDASVEVAVCGELAAHPLGAFILIGMGIESLSVGPSALAEIKKVIRSVSSEKARQCLPDVLASSTPEQVLRILTDQVKDDLDLERFAGTVGLWGVS